VRSFRRGSWRAGRSRDGGFCVVRLVESAAHALLPVHATARAEKPNFRKMTTDEVLIEGIARGVRETLEGENFLFLVAHTTSEALAKRFELLDQTEAAHLLRVTAKTLADNHIDWGLDKSVAFGAKNPRYLLSQILERAADKMVKGRRTDARTLRRLGEPPPAWEIEKAQRNGSLA